MEGRFVSYLRVSTKRQGRSGLGLEAQRKLVADHLNGGSWELVAEYVEIESGKRADRPELAKAIRHAKITGSTLVCAKIDRIGRTAAATLGELDTFEKATGRRVLDASRPHASRLETGIMAVVAEEEGRAISERTRAALAHSTKPKGDRANGGAGSVALRAWHQEHGNTAGVAAIQARAQAKAEDLRDALAARQGMSNSAIARDLNDHAILTPRQGLWTATSVRRLRDRLGC